MTEPAQFDSELLVLQRVGDYLQATLSVPAAVAGQVRPGHFVAVAVGGPESSMLLRRSFSIYRADERAGTLDIVFAVRGKGTSWMADQARGATLNLIAPLGRPFTLPSQPVPCALVAGGYGAAPMFALAARLRRRGCRVDMVLGAATEGRLFGVLEGRRTADTLTLTTDDGSVGHRGVVTDPLPEILEKAGTAVVYACGPMGMLGAVARMAAAAGAHSQVAVEESMACGVGVCMTCVLPVVGDDGRTRIVRSCTEGPVFFGDRVRWDAVGTVPADAVGAGGGH